MNAIRSLPIIAGLMVAGAAEQPDGPTPDAGALPRSPAFVEAKQSTVNRKWQRYGIQGIDRIPRLLDPEITPPRTLSGFGGDTTRTFPATGWFRTERAADRWWLVDPEGNAFLSLGLNTFVPFVEPVPPEELKRHFGGDATAWANDQVPKLRGWGFNTAGCWSDERILATAAAKIPYTTIRWPGWQRLKGPLEEFALTNGIGRHARGYHAYPDGIVPVFSPHFEAFIQDQSPALEASRDDPWLLGRFLDNELPYPNLDAYLNYQGTDEFLQPSAAHARKWLAGRRGADEPVPLEADRQAWVEVVYQRYLALVVGAMRRHDPNHLIFSPRLNGAALRSKEVIATVAGWCDVVCVNPYGTWQVRENQISEWSADGRRPVLIAEWYAKGADSGLPNKAGVGFLVKTQRDRGWFYQNFIMATLSSPAIVGWHWHRYLDNDPLGREPSPSNRDSNKGVVTTAYQPYAAALELMQQLNARIYPLANHFRQPPEAAKPAGPPAP